MIRKSPFWWSLYSAWELTCDQALPLCCRPAGSEKNFRPENIFNPLYALPLWGAAAGLIALIAGKILGTLLPVNGTALLFALIITAAGELRTSGRGLALNVTFWESILTRHNFLQAQAGRQDSLSRSNGLIPLLLAIAMLGGKFMLILMASRSGHFGTASAAWVTALTAEAVMAAEPSAVKMPHFCRTARTEYIAALGGFFLLFNLISLPLATLITAGAAAALTIVLMNVFLRKTGKIDSNDMTMIGYLLETAVWFFMSIMIG